MAKRVLLKCEVCGETFKSNILYYQHKVTRHSELKPIVTSEGTYRCPLCHEARRSLEGIHSHIGLHHVKNNPLRVEVAG